MSSEPAVSVPSSAEVDPRGPRFGQAVTMVGVGAGVTLREPALVVAIAAILAVAVASRWRVDLYSVVFKRVVVPIVGGTDVREHAAPHRFAKLLGALFTGLASLLLIAGSAAGIDGIVVAGYAVAVAVVVLAFAGSVLDICVGCRMYRQVSFFSTARLGLIALHVSSRILPRRCRGAVRDPRE